MAAPFTIGHLARTAGIKVQTVRYYEEIGLLPEAERTSGNQRRYDARARDRLTFIRHARELGFSLDAVRELLELSDLPEHPCDRADEIASRQLEAVERRIERLEALRTELRRMIGGCDHGAVSDCRVIETLSDHALCVSDHPHVEGAV